MTSLGAEHVRMSVANIMVVMPWFEKDADFQLEVLRECLLWLRFMWSDTKARATSIAQSIAILCCMRVYLNGGPCECPPWRDYLVYDKDACPTPMLWKITGDFVAQFREPNLLC